MTDAEIRRISDTSVRPNALVLSKDQWLSWLADEQARIGNGSKNGSRAELCNGIKQHVKRFRPLKLEHSLFLKMINWEDFP